MIMKTLVFTFWCFLMTMSVFASDPNSDPNMDDVIAAWKNTYSSITFNKVVWNELQLYHDSNDMDAANFYAELKECTDGRRVLQSTSVGSVAKTYFYDGNEAILTQISKRVPTLEKKAGLSEALFPSCRLADFMCLSKDKSSTNLVEIDTICKNKGLSRILSNETLGSTECYKIVFGGLRTFWLSKNHQLLPLKYELILGSQNQAKTTVVVTDIGKITNSTGVIFYPKTVIRTIESPLSKRAVKFNFTCFIPNQTPSESDFKLTVPKGTQVIDRINNKIYVVGLDTVGQMDSVGTIEPGH
jgi:hypothetical protein